MVRSEGSVFGVVRKLAETKVETYVHEPRSEEGKGIAAELKENLDDDQLEQLIAEIEGRPEEIPVMGEVIPDGDIKGSREVEGVFRYFNSDDIARIKKEMKEEGIKKSSCLTDFMRKRATPRWIKELSKLPSKEIAKLPFKSEKVLYEGMRRGNKNLLNELRSKGLPIKVKHNVHDSSFVGSTQPKKYPKPGGGEQDLAMDIYLDKKIPNSLQKENILRHEINESKEMLRLGGVTGNKKDYRRLGLTERPARLQSNLLDPSKMIEPSELVVDRRQWTHRSPLVVMRDQNNAVRGLPYLDMGYTHRGQNKAVLKTLVDEGVTKLPEKPLEHLSISSPTALGRLLERVGLKEKQQLAKVPFASMNNKYFYNPKEVQKGRDILTNNKGFSFLDNLDLYHSPSPRKVSAFDLKSVSLVDVMRKFSTITLDIEKGDILLGGRFKNVRTEVKEIGEDDNGQPTVNGKKLLNFRIAKKMPGYKEESMKKESATDFMMQLSKTALFVKHLHKTAAGIKGLILVPPTEVADWVDGIKDKHFKEGMIWLLKAYPGKTITLEVGSYLRKFYTKVTGENIRDTKHTWEATGCKDLVESSGKEYAGPQDEYYKDKPIVKKEACWAGIRKDAEQRIKHVLYPPEKKVNRYMIPVQDASMEELDKSPINLSVIPNYMGINLCSVEYISWSEMPDGQLIDLQIHFDPDLEKYEVPSGEIDIDDHHISQDKVDREKAEDLKKEVEYQTELEEPMKKESATDLIIRKKAEGEAALKKYVDRVLTKYKIPRDIWNKGVGKLPPKNFAEVNAYAKGYLKSTGQYTPNAPVPKRPVSLPSVSTPAQPVAGPKMNPAAYSGAAPVSDEFMKNYINSDLYQPGNAAEGKALKDTVNKPVEKSVNKNKDTTMKKESATDLMVKIAQGRGQGRGLGKPEDGKCRETGGELQHKGQKAEKEREGRGAGYISKETFELNPRSEEVKGIADELREIFDDEDLSDLIDELKGLPEEMPVTGEIIPEGNMKSASATDLMRKLAGVNPRSLRNFLLKIIAAGGLGAAAGRSLQGAGNPFELEEASPVAGENSQGARSMRSGGVDVSSDPIVNLYGDILDDTDPDGFNATGQQSYSDPNDPRSLYDAAVEQAVELVSKSGSATDLMRKLAERSNPEVLSEKQYTEGSVDAFEKDPESEKKNSENPFELY